MNKKSFTHVTLTRTALAVAAGLLVSTIAYAQQSEGSIYGKAKAGQKVTITSVDTNSSRQIVADANGAFSQAKLPPGQYMVTADGQTREVTVAIGTGTQVILSEIERVTITRRRNKIDVSSVESNSVFTSEQIRALPVARDINAIAILAPGVVKGDADLGAGGLPAFAGASVAENGYYINGFDVTNIRNFLSYANLPFDAISSEQIKVGGYGAEYGRSLGGVITISTKRGTNEWKGGASMYWSPEKLQSKGKNVADLDFPGDYTLYHAADTSSQLSTNAYVGGPLIKDKLFFFGIIEGKRDIDDTYRGAQSHHFKSAQPNGMIKLDFQPNDAHRLEFTGITNKVKQDVWDYVNPIAPDQSYATSHLGTGQKSTFTSGGHTLIGKYTGYVTDKLTVSALVGSVKDQVVKTTGHRVADLSCPVVLDVNLNEVGCWTGPFPGNPVRDPNAKDDLDTRKAFRIDVDYSVGDHTLKAGIDSQKFTSTAAGQSDYSGGAYYRYFVSSTGTVNGVPNSVAPGGMYARKRIRTSTSGEFDVNNDALYVEDSWKAIKNVMVYGGLRWESFNNKNADGVSFAKADRLMAPRLGASWDVNGDASLKVYGNVGRYYIPVASNTNIRATRGELFTHQYYKFTSIDPVTQAPLGTTEVGVPQVNGDGSLPLPSTIADTNLKPMSQDEMILGFEKLVGKGWKAGVKGTHRKVQNGMDDYCSHSGFERWAADNNHPNFDSSTMAGCMIVNPGNDVTLNVDIDNTGTLTKIKFPAAYIGLAKYERTYNALEFTADRPFDGVWGLNASYTWSKTQGTAEGYVNSVINQEDAGVSQDFDFPSLTDGSKGYTSNDRRHVFKVYGNYMVTDTIRLGMNAALASGRPTSCVGFVPETQPDGADAAGYSTASSYYCLNSAGPDIGRTSSLHSRGTAGRTPWTNSVDVQIAYLPKLASGKLTLQMDIFNLFNTQQVVEWQETRDFSRATTVNHPDPDAPGTQIIEGQLSKNYQRPTSFQAPRSVRFVARYEF
ncbi:MAG: TonB-dependent receptor [Pseudomonadota bacterium]